MELKILQKMLILTQYTEAHKNHSDILPKKSIVKSGFSLEPMDQLHPNLNYRLLLSSEFTRAKIILTTKAMKAVKASNPILGEIVPAALRWVLKP